MEKCIVAIPDHSHYGKIGEIVDTIPGVPNLYKLKFENGDIRGFTSNEITWVSDEYLEKEYLKQVSKKEKLLSEFKTLVGNRLNRIHEDGLELDKVHCHIQSIRFAYIKLCADLNEKAPYLKV